MHGLLSAKKPSKVAHCSNIVPEEFDDAVDRPDYKIDVYASSGYRFSYTFIGGHEVLESGDYRSVTNTERRLFVQFFHDSRTNKETTDPRLYATQPFLTIPAFKMEGVPTLRQIIEKDDLMCKLDLKDAYVVVPIHPTPNNYLTFKHQRVVYQYKSMAFGLGVAPRVFTKIMRHALEPIRMPGIRLVYYLDDICVLGKTQEEITHATELIIEHLTKIGFLINWEKSTLTPKHVQEFLGFVFNTKKMSIAVPTQKLQKLMKRLKQVMANPHRQHSSRWIASLLGKMTSMIPAIGEALLHLRYLQRDLARSLHQNHQNWESQCPLSEESRVELKWWRDLAATKTDWLYNDLQKENQI